MQGMSDQEQAMVKAVRMPTSYSTGLHANVEHRCTQQWNPVPSRPPSPVQWVLRWAVPSACSWLVYVSTPPIQKYRIQVSDRALLK